MSEEIFEAEVNELVSEAKKPGKFNLLEDALERLYEPFFSTKTDGMGMGLNVCRSIIESHHGRLWVENNATEKDPSRPGCTFTILLPIRN